MNYVIIIFLVLLSGLFSGLTIGLLSINKNDLKRKISLGDKEAKKVYSVRKNGNLLLSTLLLGNVAVNSTLAIFLGNIASGIIAGLVATGLIVVFGEIIPQAIFIRYAMRIGSKTSWLVKFFIFILYPFCWPISLILDKILSKEMPIVYSKKELIKIVEENEDSPKSDIDADEERIVKGALSYSNKTAEQIMTPRTVVFALEIDTVLNKTLLNKIKKQEFTRIPIYQDSIDNAIGVLYIKDLINIKPNTKIASVYHKEKVLTVPEQIKLDKLMNMFIKSKIHMAFVKDQYHGLEGIVTLEDIIEEILRQEIVDETDKVFDLQKKAKSLPKNSKKPLHTKKH